jgi:hypothetical protein
VSALADDSVVPSEKNSWSGCRERFCSGKTAIERMRGASVAVGLIFQSATAPIAVITSAATASATARRQRVATGARVSTVWRARRRRYLLFSWQMYSVSSRFARHGISQLTVHGLAEHD